MADSETRSWFRPGVPILTAISTVGLGSVIAVFAMRHWIETDEATRLYLQGEFAETMQSNTAASEKVAAYLDSAVDAQNKVAKELDDLGDEQRELNGWIEKSFAHMENSHN